MRKRVDAFQEEFASATTLVRLQPRQGFKGRSLNDTLKTVVGDDYEFFAVCDADSYLPSDFLSRTIPYFLLDERIAFVQANHTSRGYNQAKFAKDFEVTVDPWWRLDQLPRARYGFHMCVGHGVVMRREAWEKVGGYPEIVEEDRAFSMRLREHSYYGCFAPELVCGEEFPQDFGPWRRRQFRLVQAKIEILSTQMPEFLRNKGISFTEKLDLLVRMIRDPSQALTLPFLLFGFCLIPLADGGTLSATSIDRAFGFMLSPGLVAVTLLAAAAPLYPFFVYLRRKPLELVHILFRSFTLYCFRLTLSITSFAAYILRGRAMFLVTGAQDSTAIRSQPMGVVKGFLQRLGPESPLLTALDIACGLILGYVGLATGSLVLLGIAAILLMSPMVRQWGWHNKVISVAVYLPLALVTVGLVISLSGGIGAQSQYLVLAVLAVLLYY
jgi:cellulose synthase/poly-beta-1,6-N-acetylglucosamine synthase-like glycosyltransferase